MPRPMSELIKDYLADPSQWEVIQTDVAASTNAKNRGGRSVQELLRHRSTGEEMTRHTVYRADGREFRRPHFRAYRK